MAKKHTTKKRTTSSSSRNKKSQQRSAVSNPKVDTSAQPVGPRRFQQTKLQRFKENRTRTDDGKLMGSVGIFWRAMSVLYDYRKVFIGIWIIYGVLDLVLVRGLSSANLSSLKHVDDLKAHGLYGGVKTALALFSSIASTSTTANSSLGQIYQAILVIIISLAIVWCLRQAYAKAALKVRDGFYQGMYPLVVVLMVMVIIGLQLIPFVVSATLFANLIGGRIVINEAQKVIAGVICALIALPSIYLVTSSIFALYIATLPDMTPMKALRAARELVKHRRLLIIRKLLFIPVTIFVLGTVLMLPILILLTPIATWIFFALTMASLIIFHSYIYGLYRELI